MVVDDLYSNGMYYKVYIIGGSLIITISILLTFHLIGKEVITITTKTVEEYQGVKKK